MLHYLIVRLEEPMPDEEKVRAKHRRYRQTEAGKLKNREYVRRHEFRAKMDALMHYGGDPPKCACCGETNVGFLTIDFVGNDGHRHRGPAYKVAVYLKRKGFPAEPPVQILCFNCNCGRELNGGVCPHHQAVDVDSYRRVRRTD